MSRRRVLAIFIEPTPYIAGLIRALRAETGDPFLWAPHAFFGDWR